MTLKEMKSRLDAVSILCPELKECIIMIALNPDIEYSLCIILPEGTILKPESRLKAAGICVERERSLLWLL
jgi:hypothetical protein